jgi:hypothetical protein
MGEVGAGEIGALEISTRENGKAKHHLLERARAKIDRSAVGGPEPTFVQLQSDAAQIRGNVGISFAPRIPSRWPTPQDVGVRSTRRDATRHRYGHIASPRYAATLRLTGHSLLASTLPKLGRFRIITHAVAYDTSLALQRIDLMTEIRFQRECCCRASHATVNPKRINRWHRHENVCVRRRSGGLVT